MFVYKRTRVTRSLSKSRDVKSGKCGVSPYVSSYYLLSWNFNTAVGPTLQSRCVGVSVSL